MLHHPSSPSCVFFYVTTPPGGFSAVLTLSEGFGTCALCKYIDSWDIEDKAIEDGWMDGFSEFEFNLNL